MMKPSKKVISTMVIIGAVTVAFIVSDKIKTHQLEKTKNPEAVVEGVVEKNDNVKSLQEYFTEKFTEAEPVSTDLEGSSVTVTETILTKLYSQYTELKLQSLDNPSNVISLTEQLAEQTKSFAEIPNKYSFVDLKTSPDYQKDNSKQYGNNFASILEKYYRQEFLIENTGDDMKFIREYADIKIKQGDELASLVVPRSISDEHLEFSNNLIKSGVAIINIAEIENDPLLSGVVLNQYNEIRFEQNNILKKIAEYFRENDIIFSDDEPGAMWNNY